MGNGRLCGKPNPMSVFGKIWDDLEGLKNIVVEISGFRDSFHVFIIVYIYIKVDRQE
jgi:hypothetical protein